MISFATKTLLNLMALLPRGILQRFGVVIGIFHYQLNSQSARVTRANLALCLPDENLESMVKASLIETGRTMLETPMIWLGNPVKTDGWIRQVHGEELLKRAVDDDKGLLILLPHIGNWELFNVFYRRYGIMTALFQPPKQPVMRNVMEEVRKRHGNHMVPTTRSGLLSLYRTLETGGSVVVLPDQVPASGIFAPFFGQQALTDVLAHRLIRKTGASALGVAMIRLPSGQFDVQIMHPDDAIYADDKGAALGAMNALVEHCVELAVPQYQWEYKRFRERPDGSEKLYRFSKPPGIHT